ncbi:thioredoxin family protein [Streptomyces albidoflavus]|uniref:thioredoxin family protein n=1 Tax=Streptomyces albidoflavus TaxID=1886 RepID=UPI0021481A13|nr:thioredoxin family protein [Streptomyces albidoflavus]MCR0991485.1 thioredoxin family protein [Streptomyces albidoflavus]
MADGRETATGGTAGDGGETPLQVLDAGRLGTELGERATLVQFSTAFCQPCRATRRVLDDVAALVPGVRHVEIDAEAHLDLVRAVGVERTPTVLILDGRGRVALRATGAPRKADVLAGLAQAL